MIRLTDEEIARNIAHNCDGCKTKGKIFHEIGKPVAKAQLKKVRDEAIKEMAMGDYNKYETGYQAVSAFV